MAEKVQVTVGAVTPHVPDAVFAARVVVPGTEITTDALLAAPAPALLTLTEKAPGRFNTCSPIATTEMEASKFTGAGRLVVEGVGAEDGALVGSVGVTGAALVVLVAGALVLGGGAIAATVSTGTLELGAAAGGASTA